MADYFPLLARALDTMSDRGPDMRRVVYDRARTALLNQLRSLDPPLGEAAIERERRALDEAVARAEAAYGAEAPPRLPEATPDPVRAPPERPRVEQPPAIRRTRGRGRPLALAIGLGVVMVPVGIAGWLWRDRPAPTPRPAARTEITSPVPVTDSKLADRIGGARPAPVPVPAPAAPATGGVPAAAPAMPPRPAQPELSVAQRALLVEENTADPQQPKITGGRSLWRLDGLNAGQGLPLETVVRTIVDVPDASLSLMMTLRRNTDPAFPASHTLELVFTSTAPADQNRAIRDVALPQLKTDETVRGLALAGLSVPVKENVFLIGLSDLKSDIERNSDLLLNRNWLDLPLRFASGQRAVLSFEKGVAGERVIADAFRQWGAAAP